jgi:cation transport protein ChaC
MIDAQADSSYFGYGSLVNRHTRPAGTKTEPFRLKGWIRQWRHCLHDPFVSHNVIGNMCALTATPQPGAEIDGILVFADENELKSIDDREVGYKRERIDARKPADAAVAGPDRTAYIYVSQPDYYRWASEECPIWLSYVDCVLAGYLDVFGSRGAERFIASTEGWDRAPVIDDRVEPKYPRAVRLTRDETSTIDELLAKTGIVYS